MKTKLVLKLFKNTRGVVVGDLYLGDRGLLATTHPATIAAAIFAMDKHRFTFRSTKDAGEFEFPVSTAKLQYLEELMLDQKEVDFMSGFATFSEFDFANPAEWDVHADVHFRVAAHHLPDELIRIAPSEPQPKSFKKDLKIRNKYVYFPPC